MKLAIHIATLIPFILLIAPAVRADPKISSLIAQLASDDPLQRQSAVEDLMGLKRPDLPSLRAAAIAQSPLLPAQVAGLRQVVVQVFLAGEPYAADPLDPRGFLGVQFEYSDAIWRPDGITIRDRIPGFPAYRFLQSGDIIVKLIDWPKVQLHSSEDIINAVRYLDAGQVVRLQVLRSGRAMMIALPLDFRPVEIPVLGSDITIVDNWVDQRVEKAQAYWTRNFSAIDPAAGGGQASTSLEP